jgi:hypothetical protein
MILHSLPVEVSFLGNSAVMIYFFVHNQDGNCTGIKMKLYFFVFQITYIHTFLLSFVLLLFLQHSVCSELADYSACQAHCSSIYSASSDQSICMENTCRSILRQRISRFGKRSQFEHGQNAEDAMWNNLFALASETRAEEDRGNDDFMDERRLVESRNVESDGIMSNYLRNHILNKRR